MRTNADKLRVIMTKQDLNSREVAELIGVSLHTVRGWLLHSDAASHRPMKNRDIEYLTLKLAKERG